MVNIQTYIDAMMSASGLTENQAKTCVYYAVCTYHIRCEGQPPLMKLPTLCLQGTAGTGKTSAKEQLRRMVNGPKSIHGRTFATVRDELTDAITALIDEADNLPRLEELLTHRHSIDTGTITVNHTASQGGYAPKNHDIFGATIVCRRTPFADIAFRSRAIIIATQNRRGSYSLISLNSSLGNLARITELKMQDTSDRISDTWEPVIAVARSLKDDEWLQYAEGEVERQTMLLNQTRGIEPQVALIYALKALSGSKPGKVKLSVVKRTLKAEFDVRQKISQIWDHCNQLDLRVVNPKGYPQVEVDPERIEELIAGFEEQSSEEDSAL